MQLSLNWLRHYADFDISPETLETRLTMLGLEIEAVQRPWAEISGVKVGRILSIEPHPDADKLVVCRTDTGDGEPLQIVCGAKNMHEGDHVPTAVVGGTLPGGFKIGRRKMRGVESQGMMCSPSELGLGEDHSGLLILDKSAPVGADIVPLLGLDDVVFEIEITPNRGDWASMFGIARELRAALGAPVRIPEAKPRESVPAAAEVSSVTIEAPELCPRYAGRVLTGVQVGPSPLWLCRALLAAGMRPINNVVDVTNYVLLETGQPLHAFDFDKLTGKRIVVRTAHAGETIRTLDGEERKLESGMLIIADAEVPVAIAGVMGGEETEVGERTRAIFLESAYFDPVAVRKTARGLGMQTEASQRFQRGADPEMVQYAIDRAAALLQELCGAQVAGGILDVWPRPHETKVTTLRYSRSDLLLGMAVAPEDQDRILESLGFEPDGPRENGSRTWRVPSWRHDVVQEADLIEEVARVYGYDRVPLQLPAVPMVEREFAPHHDETERIRDLLVALGLTEFMTWTFCNAQEIEKCRLTEWYPELVQIANPLSALHAAMRPTLIPALLNNTVSNINRQRRDIRAFELGPVYLPQPAGGPPEVLPRQLQRLGIVITGQRAPKHWSAPAQPADIFDLKGIAEAVLEACRIPCTIESAAHPTLRPECCAAIMSGKTLLGHLGEVSASVAKAYDIGAPVFLMELDLDALLETPRLPRAFEDIPAFPPSLRDLAVVVDTAIPAGDLQALAQQHGGPHLRTAGIFDIYTGKQVSEGKKSVALSLYFQSTERTLTDKDTQKAVDRILQALHDQFGAELR